MTENGNIILFPGVTELKEAPGWSAETETIDPWKGVNPSEVAEHESDHAKVAFDKGILKKVTIVKGPGYDGMTEAIRYDKDVAAAAHARGGRGTGFDVWLIWRNGDDLGSAEAGANSHFISEEDQDVAKVMAAAIEVEKTVSGGRMEQVVHEHFNPTGKIELLGPAGERKRLQVKGKRGHGFAVNIWSQLDVLNRSNLGAEMQKVDQQTERPLADKIRQFPTPSDLQRAA